MDDDELWSALDNPGKRKRLVEYLEVSYGRNWSTVLSVPLYHHQLREDAEELHNIVPTNVFGYWRKFYIFISLFVSSSFFEKELRIKVVCKLPARLPGILADYSRRREVAFSFWSHRKQNPWKRNIAVCFHAHRKFSFVLHVFWCVDFEFPIIPLFVAAAGEITCFIH